MSAKRFRGLMIFCIRYQLGEWADILIVGKLLLSRFAIGLKKTRSHGLCLGR